MFKLVLEMVLWLRRYSNLWTSSKLFRIQYFISLKDHSLWFSHCHACFWFSSTCSFVTATTDNSCNSGGSDEHLGRHQTRVLLLSETILFNTFVFQYLYWNGNYRQSIVIKMTLIISLKGKLPSVEYSLSLVPL